jgi:hypothetical protein
VLAEPLRAATAELVGLFEDAIRRAQPAGLIDLLSVLARQSGFSL